MDMEITYLGNSSFKIKGKNAIVTADSNITIENTVTNTKKVLDGPGEYEVAGVSVIGIKSEKTCSYVIEMETLRLLYGYADSKETGSIDVAFVPSSVDVKQVNASIVIPFGGEMKDQGLRVENLPKLNIKEGDITSDEKHIVILEKKQ